MPDVRYVCLSDLHFGAENSLLTHLKSTAPVPDPTQPSSVLIAFVDCLEHLIAANEDNRVKPTLVLNGDVIELALASDEIALEAFQRFVELAFVDRDLFDHRIIYLPGNHDHHMWETARESSYADYIARTPPDVELNPPWHSTETFLNPDPSKMALRQVNAKLLESLIRRLPGLSDCEVVIHYPLWGLSGGNDRRVVFHHGHYMESIYRAMTHLRHLLFPASRDGLNIWDWEAENFAWVDFFWSTLGRSGQWGGDVSILYDMLEDEVAVGVLADNLADAAMGAVHPWWFPKLVRRPVLHWAMHEFGKHIADQERPYSGAPLSPKGEIGLAALLNGPVSRELGGGDSPVVGDVAFVFGHTHNPSAGTRVLSGYRSPVVVYNTGGWVVDTLRPDTSQGAAAVVLDESLNVCAIRLYEQQSAGAAPVAVQAAAGGKDNPLYDRLNAVINADEHPWHALTQAVEKAIPSRYAALRTIIDGGIAQAKKRP